MIETLDTYLENAMNEQRPIQLVLGGRVDAPVAALVRARNGSTFELAIGGATVRMDLSAVVVRVS